MGRRQKTATQGVRFCRPSHSYSDKFGFGDPPPARVRGTRKGVRSKKRLSHGDGSGVNRSGTEARNVHRSRGTVIEGLESAGPTRKVDELPTSNVREPVSVPVLEPAREKAIDELSNRFAVLEEVVRSETDEVCTRFGALEEVVRRETDEACTRFGALEGEVRNIKRGIELLAAEQRDLATRIEQRVAAVTVTVSAQDDVIQKWKQEAGALVAVLRQAVGSSTPAAVPATAIVVETEVGNWDGVLAAEKLKPKPWRKERPGSVVATVKGETARMEEKPKMEEEVPYPAAVGSIEERQVSFRSVQLEFLKPYYVVLIGTCLGLGLRWMFVGLWACSSREDLSRLDTGAKQIYMSASLRRP